MPIPELIPGDCLLYFNRASFFDWVIAIKTWTLVGHVEVYAGGGMSYASRNGKGVDTYALRLYGLVMIRRPKIWIPEIAAGWMSQVRGQKYDWLGLLVFTLAVRQGSPNKMFCSEFATRLYRQVGLDVVAPDWDADETAPAQFVQSAGLSTVWTASEARKAA